MVQDVLYVASEGFGCGTDWNAFSYRAYGNEPFWRVEVSQSGLHLTRPGEPEQPWRKVQKLVTDGVIRYTGTLTDGTSSELVIERTPCRDTMSGAFFGLSATLRLGSEEFAGCVLMGNEEDGRQE